MVKLLNLKLISTVLIGTLLSNCSSKKNENFDINFSDLKLPSQDLVKISDSDDSGSLNKQKEVIKNELIKYKKRSEVLNSVPLGKKDPFSSEEIQENNLTSNFVLTGFLNTGIDKYVFVNYFNNEGTITERSIGGINTNLLPNGAKVINIDPQKMKLTINFDNKEYTFEL